MSEHRSENDVPDICLLADHIARRCQHAEGAFDAIHKALCDERLIDPDADSDALVDWIAAHTAAAEARGAERVVAAVESVYQNRHAIWTDFVTAAREAARNAGAS